MIRLCAGMVFLCPKEWMVNVIENKGYRSGDIIDGYWIVDNHKEDYSFVRVWALNSLDVIDSDRPLTLPEFIELQNSSLGFRYIRVKG